MSWEKSNYTAAGARPAVGISLRWCAGNHPRCERHPVPADADLSGETGVSGETHDLKLLDIETVEAAVRRLGG